MHRIMTLLNKLGLHVADSTKVTKQHHSIVRLFKELHDRASKMQLPDAFDLVSRLKGKISEVSARCTLREEDKVCVLIRLGLVLCNTRSLEAAIQLGSLVGSAFDLDKPSYEDYACIALDGVAKSIGQRYTTLLLHRELQERGRSTRAKAITKLVEEVTSKRPTLTHEKVKSLLRNCDSRSKVWQCLSSNFDGDDILCLIVANEKGMTASQ